MLFRQVAAIGGLGSPCLQAPHAGSALRRTLQQRCSSRMAKCPGVWATLAHYTNLHGLPRSLLHPVPVILGQG
jgi:hypothetical protein